MKMGENLDIDVKGDILIIKIDLSKRGERSASGKTIRIASSLGNQSIGHPSGAVLGINVYAKE